MTKVLILGASGMLGSAALREFSNFKGEVIATKRAGGSIETYSNLEVREFDAETDSFAKLAHDIGADDFVINCIGLVKARIDESIPSDLRKAELLNTELPLAIQEHVLESKAKVIQIATDCVFTGSVGNYSEGDFHDEVDTYGKTKSLGEVSSSNFMHIRVSIIGPELSGHTSLYDWVRMQPHGAKIRGFVNHFWNGIPALHFAKISRAIIENQLFLPGLLHLVPADSVSKYELVTLIAEHLNRHDLEIVPFETAQGVNRVLTTEKPSISLGLWQTIGHREAPSIRQLVAEI